MGSGGETCGEVDVRSGAEEEDHSVKGRMLAMLTMLRIWHGYCDVHKRVGEADFGAVDSAIAGAFDDGEDVVILGVENDALDRGLGCALAFGAERRQN